MESQSEQGSQRLSPADAKQRFIHQLDQFVFFHLGSDCQVDINDKEDGLSVTLEHARVRPLSFRLSWPEAARLASDASAFEAFMLDYLSRFRRS